MDIEKLIEQLNRYFEGKELKRGAALDAATALSALQSENEELRGEVKRLKSLLGENGQDLWSKENQRADRLEAELELEREKHQHTQEVAWAHETELEQVKRVIHGDCYYCTHYTSDLSGPCKTCSFFAAQEFIAKDYWQWCGQKED